MHTIILPYYCEEEVERYTLILRHLQSFRPSRVDFRFLLAASPKTSASDRLYKAASAVAPVQHFECPSQVFGYPEGPSAMFWDCMDHLAKQAGDGFALWLESDMCPVRPDWVERLDSQWRQCGDVLVMGTVIPHTNRLIRKTRWTWRGRRHHHVHVPWIGQHVNGGACYRNDLVRHMPDDHREGIFDTRLGQILATTGGYADTPSIRLTTEQRLAMDLEDPNVVLVHGYLQAKDPFIDWCTGRKPIPRPSAAPDGPDTIRRTVDSCPRRLHLDATFAIKDRTPAVLTVYHRNASMPHPQSQAA
ncbi:hypothetical protein V7x_51260 [Crateriforma conspicua]|uniref:Glycosyl transferase family 2 n=1 Tax=Crateriforma conspicua TaxID=2527996 RepID=A0A5C6FSA6_9PLAN|nr:hypothetical protein [Crateriforma conspicua]TWU63386.1 hypothetical protein V7x_51260 [Crateriforma conspicua]